MSETCCPTKEGKTTKPSFDIILWGSSGAIGLAIFLSLLKTGLPYIDNFAHASLELLATMWWGIVLGVFFVSIMSKIPREYFTKIMGEGDKTSGIFRAAIAGLFLDLCSHGILMVGAKLYERGASTAQIMTFLIASPWNSLSLTIILLSLIGWFWTLAFIIASAVIAILSGLIFIALEKAGALPENPNKSSVPHDFSILDDFKKRWSEFKPSRTFFWDMAKSGVSEAKMLVRWLLLGVVIASAVRAFVPPDIFADWFGPTIFGLAITLIAATIMEVCSEGLAPVASEIMHGAAAPGNAFTFLMAGVATDYTEIMVLREATKSWKIALALPIVTVPQVIIIGYIMNVMGA